MVLQDRHPHTEVSKQQAASGCQGRADIPTRIEKKKKLMLLGIDGRIGGERRRGKRRL